MPGLDGWRFVERDIPALCRIPVIAVSGLGTEADVMNTWAAGFNGHLIQPVDDETIAAQLERALLGAPAEAAGHLRARHGSCCTSDGGIDMLHRTTLIATCVVVAGILTVAGRAVSADEPIERFTAFAVDMSNLANRTRAGAVDITVERWSTDQERDRLVAALREGGPDALLKTLNKMKAAGRIHSPGSIGYPLQFARQMPLPDGARRIILATDRPISFLEMTRGARTLDYPFLLIELRLNAEGKGEGKLLPLARITANSDRVVEIENYASEPVRLMEVRQAK